MKEDLITFVVPMRPVLDRYDRAHEWIIASDNLPIRVVVCLFKTEVITESLRILREFEVLRPNYLKIYEHTEETTGGARNIGLNMVDTDWVAFADSDDIAYPDVYLKWIADKQASDVHIGGFGIREHGSTKVGEMPSGGWQLKKAHYIASNPGIWRFLFKTEFAKKTSFPNLNMGEDLLFLARMNLQLPEIEFHRENCYTYVRHGMQLTMSTDRYHRLHQTFEVMNKEINSYNTILSLTLYIKVAISLVLKSNLSLIAKITILKQGLQNLVSILTNSSVKFAAKVK